MNTLGKLMWKAACEKVGELGITEHPLTYLSKTMSLGEKTLQRRMCDGEWMHRQLVEFQQHFKDDAVQRFIDDAFSQARES